MNLKRPLKLSARCMLSNWGKEFPCANHQAVKLNSCRQKLSMQIFVWLFVVPHMKKSQKKAYSRSTLIILSMGDFVFVIHNPFKLTVGASCQEVTLCCAIQ